MKCSLQNKIRRYIEDNSLFSTTEKILVANSGGVDSMVLSAILLELGYRFSIAHCNFNLRGKDSDGDQQFVSDWCSRNGIELFVKSFDTRSYAGQNNLSIEMAARELRYDWFEEVRSQNNFQCIVVGHHLNDQFETVMLNMTRGLGIRGYLGMMPRNGYVVRPMLTVSRDEIEEYTIVHNIAFRLDNTNELVDFKRNRIRHNIAPQFEKLNPSYLKVFKENIKRLSGVWHFMENVFQEMESLYVKVLNNQFVIQIPDEHHKPVFPDFLNFFFTKNNFRFNINEVVKLINSQTGKKIELHEYVLMKNRGEIVIMRMSEKPEPIEMSEKLIEKILFGQFEFHFRKKGNIDFSKLPGKNHTVWIDWDSVEFPLVIRSWERGDTIKPLGMRGTKKISDVLTDKKIPAYMKKDYPVIVSSGNVIWLPGITLNQNSAVKKTTASALEISINNIELNNFDNQ